MTIAPEVSRSPVPNRATPRHERRFRWIALLVVVVLALGVAAYAAWSGRQTRDVPQPATSASPRQVVLAYLAALDARDCDTQQRLWLHSPASAREGCRDTASIDGVRVVDVETTADGTRLVHVVYDQRLRLFHGSTSDVGQDAAFNLHHDETGAWRIAERTYGDG